MKKLEQFSDNKILRMPEEEFYTLYSELDSKGTYLLILACLLVLLALIYLIVAIFSYSYLVYLAFVTLFISYILFNNGIKFKKSAIKIFKLRYKG